MEHFYHKDNFGEQWFDYQDLYRMFVAKAPSSAHFVEVGSWKGRSSAFLAVEIINSKKNIRLDCVDTWSGSLDPKEVSDTSEYQNDHFLKTDKLYDLFLSNTELVSTVINPIRKSSVEAAKDYRDESLDVVFIDACHTYQCVHDDINAWMPKVKPGGFIAGHDIHSDAVKSAVLNTIKKLETFGSCWIHKK